MSAETTVELTVEANGIRINPGGQLIPWDDWDWLVYLANRRRAADREMAELREKMP